ncbi:unnamed protein product [Adineta ricciae]|uniref:Uncharacterized protein n=1 Tax=Adineta ricciae TaxID=249248 RepID=A0A815HZC1_ADIRI|nr:unnamed protein product [Adineta ricciae]CAF1516718.1 unnamed protein product [Adineta ricciae]
MSTDTSDDTVVVHLQIDDNTSLNDIKSRSPDFLSQGVWTWNKILFVGLIALCIIGIILALLFLIIGKKFNKNKRTQASGSTTTTKSVVTSNVAAGGRYEPVRNV